MLGRVGLCLMHGAGLQGGLVGDVVEGHQTVSVPTAERAEGGFFCGVDVDVDAFAEGLHAVWDLRWDYVLVELTKENV